MKEVITPLMLAAANYLRAQPPKKPATCAA